MITTTYDPEQWQLVPKALSDEMFEMISTQGWKSILEVAPAHPQCDWVDANGNPPHPSVQEKMAELINNEKVYTQLIGMSYRECRDLLDHRLGHISRLKEELAIALAIAPQHESQWQPIETAPKDCNIILFGRWWSDEQGWMKEPVIGRWNQKTDGRWEFANAGGWWGIRPTVWTPLPQHPDTPSRKDKR